ncbi:ABC transporter permease [Phaeocystidibacter luteus]|uniref:ABC transporter permease subunit n=1 Tax=Phaeocystidibacter luteus TaxID=911197 RepID=A0A6N6RJ82_9FLAO|nr:ABC transporter permease [Phaeocystidibacter luteus]KAB2813704.1 hypothetical protein F8C67_05965 [Phaeocystidibacter luteus]
MIRLFYIEWLKISRSRYFKWMMGLWLFAFLVVPFGIDQFLSWINDSSDFISTDLGVKPEDFPVFYFIDIWHNLSYIYKLITPLLCIIVIVNVGQEWEEKTIRQNVIDGLSRTEYFFSKVILLAFLSFLSFTLLLILGLVLGGAMSGGFSWNEIVSHIDFLFAYWLHIFLHLNIAMLAINLMRKVGLTILIFLLYMYFIEPVAWGILGFMHAKQGWADLAVFLPIDASWSLIPSPLGKYITWYVHEHVQWSNVYPALAWLGITLLANARLMISRDLR